MAEITRKNIYQWWEEAQITTVATQNLIARILDDWKQEVATRQELLNECTYWLTEYNSTSDRIEMHELLAKIKQLKT